MENYTNEENEEGLSRSQLYLIAALIIAVGLLLFFFSYPHKLILSQGEYVYTRLNIAYILSFVITGGGLIFIIILMLSPKKLEDE